MQKRKFGNSDLEVSALGFGGWPMGGTQYGTKDRGPPGGSAPPSSQTLPPTASLGRAEPHPTAVYAGMVLALEWSNKANWLNEANCRSEGLEQENVRRTFAIRNPIGDSPS